jgi:di/tricarboxylate transporter
LPHWGEVSFDYANVLMLIAGTIALGTAMEKTGTSQLYAAAYLAVLTCNRYLLFIPLAACILEPIARFC